MKLHRTISRNVALGMLAGCLAAAQSICSQQPAPQQQSPPPANPQQPAQAPGQTPPNNNPFPEDTGNVPVLPNAKTATAPEYSANEGAAHVNVPAGDADPARSPDDANAGMPESSGSESSSSVPDIDKMLPTDDEDRKHHGKGDAPEYHETAANDIDVGNYELDRKNWKGALSRFQSAMVLDPENPDAFFGMAEAARHLGDFASARSYYQRVVDYDPDSKHGKEARKALKDPQIANAQAAKAPPAQSRR